MNPMSTQGSAPEPGQVCLGAGLIQKDQPGRVEGRLLTPPLAARPGNVGPALLGGAQRLFLYVRPISPST